MILALLLASTLTIEDYATMPALSTPRLSPDGARVAYVLSRADLKRSVYDTDIWIVRSDGSGDRQLTRSDGADVEPQWSPDGKRIAFLSDREGGRQSIWLIDPDGGEPRRVTNEPTPIRGYRWSPDGKSIAFLRLDEPTAEEERRTKEKEDPRVVGVRKHVHLHVVDVASGAVRKLTSGAFSIWQGLSWSPDGEWIAIDRAPGTSLDDLYRSDIYLVSTRDGSMKPFVTRPGLDRGPVFSPDGKWIAFTTTGSHDWLLEHQVHVMPANGGPSRYLSQAYDRTPDAIFWGDDSHTVYFEGPWNTTTQLFRVNIDGTGFTDTTKVDGVIGDADMAAGRVAYVQQSLTEPPEIHVGGKRVTNHNAAWRNRTLGETRVVRWKNPKDNLEIEALLTLPVGYTRGQRVPLLTFIHGGPASRFDQGFLGYHGLTYAPHVLAARGFAILRPNPRGTGGYGSAFHQANRNDWAVMPWLDIESGIDKLIADGIADPKRLGVMGWSYGGYLAAWALGHSDRFRAFSIGAAPTDLLSYHGTADIRDFLPHYFDQRETPDPALAEQWSEMRHPPLSVDLLRSQSPAWHLKPTKAKVLIQHGENDDRVPLSQGTLLYRLLDELGVDVSTWARGRRSGRSSRA
jgi:dipeptidyl aminopeptidase/acylaminoacyl peptidase